MTFAEILAKVLEEIERPDMAAQATTTIQASTLKMHTVEGHKFYKDIKTAQLVFETSQFIQILDKAALPRFRDLSYFRKWDPNYLQFQIGQSLTPPFISDLDGVFSNQDALRYLEPITPDSIFDYQGDEKTDVVYMAGSTIYMKSSTSFQYGLIGFFAFPDIDTAHFDSWIAQDYPFAIIYDAASALLQKIGMQEVSRKYDNGDPANPGLVKAHVQALISSNIDFGSR